MIWLGRSLIGPGLWALGFAAVYALHGLGCGQGWAEGGAGLVAHRLGMAGLALAAVAGCAWLLWWLPAGEGLPRRLPRAGAWIGLGASMFTLLPPLVLSSC